MTDLADKISILFGMGVAETINSTSQMNSKSRSRSSAASYKANQLNQNCQPGPPLPFNFNLPRKSVVSKTTITELPLLDAQSLKNKHQSHQSHQSEQSSATIAKQSTSSQSRRESRYAESQHTESSFSGQSSTSRREQEQYFREEELALGHNLELRYGHGPQEVQIPDWRMVSMEEILSPGRRGSDDWGSAVSRDTDEEEAVVKV